jgi:hypothetical protein
MAEAVPERAPAAGLLHRGLGRVEFFDYARGDLEALSGALEGLAGEGRSAFSFHAPIVRPGYFPFPGEACFFLNEDPAKRALSFGLLGDTLTEAGRWGAEYVVTHLTYGPSDTLERPLALRLAGEACARLASLSREAEVPVDIEFAAYSPAFDRPEDFLAVVAEHPELGLCLDVGHAFVGAERRQADFLAEVATLAPWARSLHLWNSRGLDHTRRHGHVPLHPSQRPAEGWIDMERVLDRVLEGNPMVRVVFEYPVLAMTPEIEAGYDWIAELVATRLPAAAMA